MECMYIHMYILVEVSFYVSETAVGSTATKFYDVLLFL